MMLSVIGGGFGYQDGALGPPEPLPEYIYKITPTAPPNPIPEQYPLSDLDQKDGFVHLSTSWQIPITADLFFKDTSSFHILKLRRGNFDPASIKWNETEGTNGCPHLYSNFGLADVVSVREFRRAEGQSWKEALEAEKSWLE